MKHFAILFLLALLCCWSVFRPSHRVLHQQPSLEQSWILKAPLSLTRKLQPPIRATGISRIAKTTSTGNYVIPNLAARHVHRERGRQGLFPWKRERCHCLTWVIREISAFKINMAGSTESVEVTTAAPLIETTRTDVSTSDHRSRYGTPSDDCRRSRLASMIMHSLLWRLLASKRIPAV